MSNGVLLIHGFTATPACLESLAQPLRQNGFVVRAPLLAGHAQTEELLKKTTWPEWYAGVQDELTKLQKETDRQFVAGLSLGGLLTLRLASERLASEFKLSGMALLATPLVFRSLAAKVLLPLIGNTPLQRLYPYQRKWAGPAINDPAGREQFKSYVKMPIAAIMEIVRLQHELAPRLAQITTPTLILHARHDTTAPYENMEIIRKALVSAPVETVTLERSDHVLTMDYEKKEVAERVVKFFKELP